MAAQQPDAVQAPVTAARSPYDLAHPTDRFELPVELTEVSALTDVDSTTVACLQDEAATIYFLSLKNGAVVGTYPFSTPGDMEGLTRVGEAYYALRSDGLIFRLLMKDGGLSLADTFRLAVPNHNIEGLGYDDRTGRILISPKDFAKGSKEARDERVIYAMGPADPTHAVVPVLRLSVDDLITQAKAKGIAVPMRATENGGSIPALKLRYSSVAVHPLEDRFYLLSAVDRTLLVVDREGRLVDLVQLDPALLPKAEGITFLANGDLVLSSEGKGRPPVLVRYRYTGK